MSRRLTAVAGVLFFGCATPHQKTRVEPPQPEVKVMSAEVDRDAWRSVRPSVPAPQPITPPAVQQLVLKNGIPVYLVESHRTPLVVTEVVVRTGYAERAVGLGRLVLTALSRGPAALSAPDFADRVESLGAVINTRLQPDYGTISIDVLTEHWPAATKLLAEAVIHPELGTGRVDSLRKEMLAQTASRAHLDWGLALDTLQQLVYGEHPYGWSTLTGRSLLERLTARDARQFHEDFWRPENVAIIVAGDATLEQTRALANETFGAWQPHGRKVAQQARPKPGQGAHESIVLIDRPAAAQATVLAGALAPARSSTSFAATVVANRVLGSEFSSRLNMNLRERKGYSYAIRSAISSTREGSMFYTVSALRVDKAGESVHEILRELDGLRAHPPDAQELQTAKESCMIGGALDLETNLDLAAALAPIVALDLPLDELTEQWTKVSRVSVEDLNAIAASYLNAAHTSVVIVGPATSIAEQLKKVGITQFEIRSAP
jgi:zinc protease